MTATRWPAERFYWAVVDAPQWHRAGTLPPGLMPLFEEETPVAPGNLHAVCAPFDEGRLLVCAAERSGLEELLASGASSLVADEIPAWIGERNSTDDLNLLVGEFEPAAARRARTRRHTGRAAAVLLSTLLASVGLWRRGTAYEADAARVRKETDVMVERAMPGGSAESLMLETERSRRAMMAAGTLKPAPDAAAALALLLRAWPSTTSARPQTVAVSESGAAVSVAVTGDGMAFLKAMKAPSGWTLDEPRVNTADSVTRIALQIRPAKGDR